MYRPTIKIAAPYDIQREFTRHETTGLPTDQNGIETALADHTLLLPRAKEDDLASNALPT